MEMGILLATLLVCCLTAVHSKPQFSVSNRHLERTAIGIETNKLPDAAHIHLTSEDNSSETDQDGTECGVENTKDRRVVGGVVTHPNKYPWMVGLLRPSDRLLFCGGALISKRHVLTAGHCTRGRKAKDILVGVRLHNSTYAKMEDQDGAYIATVAEIRQHEKFRDILRGYDISVLVLRKEAVLDRTLRPICLPSLERSFAGESVIVAGWGRILHDGSVSTLLREVSLPVVNRSECSRAMRDVLKVIPEMICAGYIEGGKDACQGDSGGPLMWQNEATGRWHVVGIVSFGVGCAKEGYYGVYTRVISYLNWISKVTA